MRECIFIKILADFNALLLRIGFFACGTKKKGAKYNGNSILSIKITSVFLRNIYTFYYIEIILVFTNISNPENVLFSTIKI